MRSCPFRIWPDLQGHAWLIQYWQVLHWSSHFLSLHGRYHQFCTTLQQKHELKVNRRTAHCIFWSENPKIHCQRLQWNLYLHCQEQDAFIFRQLTWTSCVLMSSAHQIQVTAHPFYVEATPGGPRRKTRAQHLPQSRGYCGTIQPRDSSGSAAEKQNQATWEALRSTKARGKERIFPGPTPPLTCIHLRHYNKQI